MKKEYDVIVAGGGITGAGVFSEAVSKGLNVLLVEAKDFAWGTSSRSSKMVHGGLRYLKQGRFFLTKAAVKERERLLRLYPGLVTPLNFIMPVFDHYGPSEAIMKTGLFIYSVMAGKKQHQFFTRAAALEKMAGVDALHLLSAVGFMDAQVDDARLVLRLIHDACRKGGTALNYAKLTHIERNLKKQVAAVGILDQVSGKRVEIKTKVLINATGAFAETLHPSPVKGFHIRPLRGSHLVFPGHLLPLDRVISFIHPRDLRPVFLFPWEGAVFLGTTDVDHNQDMETDPFVTKEEAAYLMDGVKAVFPGLDLSLSDCMSSLAGVRPVLSKKKRAASKESREHVVWKDKGLVTVTGGKLTTFRLLANDALKAAKSYLPGYRQNGPGPGQPPCPKEIGNRLTGFQERLSGRYGAAANQIMEQHDETLFSPIDQTSSLWVELCHAAEHEQVHHLSDLLLRRVRIGLFLPRGGMHLLDRIKTLCQPYLLWDDIRWEKEIALYLKVWQSYYSPPHNPEENQNGG